MSLGDSLRDMLAWVDQSISTDAAFVVSVDVRSDILYLVGRFWLLEHLSCTNLLTDLSLLGFYFPVQAHNSTPSSVMTISSQKPLGNGVHSTPTNAV